jgi:hypothetical protein
MFSKQHYTTPSLTKVLGSNGCDALRRFQGQHCMTFPGEVVPLYFSFCLLHFFLVFWGQFFFFEVFLYLYFFFFSFWLVKEFSLWELPFGSRVFFPPPPMTYCYSTSRSFFQRKVGTLHDEYFKGCT